MPLPCIDPALYPAQLAEKVALFNSTFAPFSVPEPSIFASAPLHYRLRAEFRIWQTGQQLDYAMFDPDNPKQPIAIDDFPTACSAICALMPRLKERLQASNTLKDGLFQADFLATLSGELMVTLIYHRRLTERWEMAARQLASDLNIQLIGRSRKQKVVLDRDWLLESFELNGRLLRYQQIEGSFTQPNGGVNQQMLAWACQQASGLGGNLLELYCGNGNFTVALAPLFTKVLATEVSNPSVKSAQYNLNANNTTNVTVQRIASDELSKLLTSTDGQQRLGDVALERQHFSTLFVDPPRSGLDATTLQLAASFDHILYISCNLQSLQENVTALQTSHRIAAAAIFDQFPYTHHLECGLLLTRR